MSDPSAPASKRLRPFAVATIVLSAASVIMTLAVVLRVTDPLISVLGLVLLASPLAWTVIFAWAERAVGRRANWLLLGLPFAFSPWFLVAYGVFLVWWSCGLGHGVCDL